MGPGIQGSSQLVANPTIQTHHLDIPELLQCEQAQAKQPSMSSTGYASLAGCTFVMCSTESLTASNRETPPRLSKMQTLLGPLVDMPELQSPEPAGQTKPDQVSEPSWACQLRKLKLSQTY